MYILYNVFLGFTYVRSYFNSLALHNQPKRETISLKCARLEVLCLPKSILLPTLECGFPHVENVCLT